MKVLHSTVSWTLLAWLLASACISKGAPTARSTRLIENRAVAPESPVVVGFNKDAFSALQQEGVAQQLRPLSEVYNEIMQQRGNVPHVVQNNALDNAVPSSQETLTALAPSPTILTTPTIASISSPTPTFEHHFGPGLAIPSPVSSQKGPQQTTEAHQAIPENHNRDQARNVALVVSIVVFVVFTAILIAVTPSARKKLRHIYPGRRHSVDDDESSDTSSVPPYNEKESHDSDDIPFPTRQRLSNILRTSFRSPSWLKMPSQIAGSGNAVDLSRSRPLSPPATDDAAAPRLIKQVLDIRTDWLRSRFSDSSSEIDFEDVTGDGMLSTIQEAEEVSLHAPDHSKTTASGKADLSAPALMSPQDFFTLPSNHSLDKEHKRRSSAPVDALFGHVVDVNEGIPSPIQSTAKGRRSASTSLLKDY